MYVYDVPDAVTCDQAIFFFPAKEKKKNRLIAGYWCCFYRDANEAKHDHELELEVACVAGGIVWVRD